MSDNSAKGFYWASSYLGQDHRVSNGIRKKTACMAIDERVLIGDLDAIIKVYPILDNIGEMDLPTLIKKVILPFVENEGIAKWQRDVVTDMAILKGSSKPSDRWGKKPQKGDDEITEDPEE